MSASEKSFIKWFAGIASALVIFSIIGLIRMYKADGVMEQRVTGIESTHKTDVGYIKDDIKEIKDSQLTIQADIKELLKK